MRYLLDANILSEARKSKPSPKVLSWLLQNGSASGLSVLTIGEFIKGANLIPPGRRRRGVEQWIEELKTEFAGRLVPMGVDEMCAWGKMYAASQTAGRVLPLFDSLLAATALTHNLTLVTRNVADFVETGVTVFNPFE